MGMANYGAPMMGMGYGGPMMTSYNGIPIDWSACAGCGDAGCCGDNAPLAAPMPQAIAPAPGE
jgi:hypothetical protein